MRTLTVYLNDGRVARSAKATIYGALNTTRNGPKRPIASIYRLASNARSLSTMTRK